MNGMLTLDTAPALWDPATGRVYTFMIDGRSAWGKETLKELIASGKVSPESKVVPQEEGLVLQAEADRSRYCTGPQQIDAEQFDDYLNMLPPQLWTRLGSSESFRISEPLCGDIYTWCVRIGDRYWRINESAVLSHSELTRLCLAPADAGDDR